ncbi:ABC transporter ATP-binding protein [Pseudoruegeria sp. SHC-113]|uniref:ABC transporter ATP-binding protein n=1 Tax=Pseudoruegeria sp. SHC-113 TaxID=2855439 RepID=UPI0021BB8AA7|nr:sn-glycerol-3-phosphate ABC transporter ATP-binding protein UgpC [Pseudoruegeria sp. SHC-113]MCT8160674.1 sn-glycerol-3-phosphate ABC transporter ATP-binding protein UgpC [Pseudoruegeria sp. SHC-113]
MPALELASFTKSYGTLEVIHGIDLDIEEGSFTVFVGPSGCGKSTLLRMIAGLEKITGGELRIEGARMNEANPVERGVTMVFQNYALYPHMSVRKNIGFGLKMLGVPRDQIEERVLHAARSLQIEPLLDRKPAQLSGGQRQRVAIGRAIVREPRLFLFDEPLSNLDAELRVAMRVELAKLHQEIGATMIYVTHDQTEALTLADKIVVLRDGRIEQQGSPMELYEDPANEFVAGFIGSPRMNFLPGHYTAGVIALEAGPCVAFAPEGGALAEGAAVKIGVRPEHFGPGSAGLLQLPAHVDVIENLGGTRYIYGSLETGLNIIAETRDPRPPKPGSALMLCAAPEHLLAFDAAGNRLRGRFQVKAAA